MSAARWAQQLTNDLTLARGPQLAPDGTRIAYITERARHTDDPGGPGGTVAELWLADAELHDARRLVVAVESAVGVRWAPDSRRIAYVAANRLLVADLDPDVLAHAGVANLDADAPAHAGTPDVDADVPAHVVAAPADEGFVEVAWSPDGERVVQLRASALSGAGVPRVVESVDFLADGVGFACGRRYRVVVSDLGTDAERELAAGPHPCSSLAWHPDGGEVAFVRETIREYESRAWIVALDGIERPVGSAGGHAVTCAFSPSGRRLLVVGREEAAHCGSSWRLLVYDAGSGRLEAASAECEQALRRSPLPVWLDEERVLVGGVRAGSSELAVWDVRDGDAVPRVIDASRALRFELSADATGSRVVQVHTSPNHAGELVVRELADGRETISERNRAVLDASGPVTVERLDLSSGDAPLDVWTLRRAELDTTGPRPLVFDIHGGPQDYFGDGFDVRQQALARHGFVVAYCNPSGSDGYGADYAARVNDRWDAAVEDVLRALDAVCGLPYVNGERAGVMGFSYGGYLAAMTLARTDRLRAGVCGCGVFDLESWLWKSEVPDPRQCGFGDLRRETLDARSPLTFVDQIHAPLLLLHGEQDFDVPVAQSDWMYRALKHRGREVAYVRYPGSAHRLMIGAPGYQIDLISRVLAWFNRHLEHKE